MHGNTLGPPARRHVVISSRRRDFSPRTYDLACGPNARSKLVTTAKVLTDAVIKNEIPAFAVKNKKKKKHITAPFNLSDRASRARCAQYFQLDIATMHWNSHQRPSKSIIVLVFRPIFDFERLAMQNLHIRASLPMRIILAN